MDLDTHKIWVLFPFQALGHVLRSRCGYKEAWTGTPFSLSGLGGHACHFFVTLHSPLWSSDFVWSSYRITEEWKNWLLCELSLIWLQVPEPQRQEIKLEREFCGMTWDRLLEHDEQRSAPHAEGRAETQADGMRSSSCLRFSFLQMVTAKGA